MSYKVTVVGVGMVGEKIVSNSEGARNLLADFPGVIVLDELST